VIGSEVFPSAGLITIVLAASLVTGPCVGLLAVIAWLVMVNLTVSAGPSPIRYSRSPRPSPWDR
jgi:hypothetical protein